VGLETGTYRPLGAGRDRLSDFRLISASNEDLPSLVKQQRFREDLLYRVGGHVVRMPGLNERRGDIPIIARHFLSQAGTTGSDDALRVLPCHSWTGNIRELRHVVDGAIIVADGAEVGSSHIEAALGGAPMPIPGATDDDERHRLRAVLERHGWDTQSAASEFRVHRATLYRWMQRMGVVVPPPAAARQRLAEPPAASLRILKG
jgi:transcriptional regulator of acetoin/glycerol metabolism